MGSNLRRQLREALPETIKGLPRAVALEIADDARWDDAWRYNPEHGRRSKARLSDLTRWTASKNERVVRDALRNLSLAGWEFRLPMGKDKKGNPLYAVPGHALEFRVPDFEPPTVVGPTDEGTVTTGPIGTVTTGPSPEGAAKTAKGTVTTAEGPVVTAEGPVTTVAATVTTGPPSPISSFSRKESPSSSPVAEDSEVVTLSVTTEEGGGGGEIIDQEERDEYFRRVDAFVGSLDLRGQVLTKQQRIRVGQRVLAAFESGWSEAGLRRYLDISDDPNVRSAAAVYLHRLSDGELPEASVGESPQLPPACGTCLDRTPAAASDLSLRVNPITSDPCPNCHPAAVSVPPQLPPACDACLRNNPAARTNVRFRRRVIDGENQACPDCSPTRIAFLATQKSQQQQETDAWADRAMARAQQRMATGNWNGAGTDERAAGWMALSRGLGAKEGKTSNIGRHYSNDVWHRPADPVEAAKIPHCGSAACDPVTRLKTEPDWSGEVHTSICGDCHPALKL